MKDYGTWWIAVPPKPMKWSKEMTEVDWAVERARDDADVLFWRQILQIPIKRRQARWRFGFACALLISILMWVALIEGGKWLLS